MWPWYWQNPPSLLSRTHTSRFSRLQHGNHPNGGVFLVAFNSGHANRLFHAVHTELTRLNRNFGVGLQGGETPQGNLVDNDDSVGIVIGTINSNVGFNLERLGHMIIGVYACNAAARYQIRGRIKRMTQKHTKLTFTTVVPQGTVLELLHNRQLSNDARANSIEQIGQEWLLQQPAVPAPRPYDDDYDDEDAPPAVPVGNKRARARAELLSSDTDDDEQ